MVAKKQRLEPLARFTNKFYPDEMATKVAYFKYTNDENKPYNILLHDTERTQKARDAVAPSAVAHWFMRDFRMRDNNGLSQAYALAKKHNLPMVCFWVNCPEQRAAHLDSTFKTYYRMLSLRELEKKLDKLNIPLVTVSASKRSDIVPAITNFLKRYNISHMYGNVEYEVDELRLASSLVHRLLPEKIAFQPCHDSCVVQPGELKTKSKGTQFAVFSPWYRQWLAVVNDEYLGTKDFMFATPSERLENAISVDETADFPEPEDLDKAKFDEYHPEVGEDAALERLRKYIHTSDVKRYNDTRDMLADDTVSHLSKHISSGTISTRTILGELHAAKKLTKANRAEAPGILEWVRQVSWRDFYRHVMCNWPYVCMNKPFALELAGLEWEYNRDHWLKWCEGSTGFPIVDACMRCLNETGYLNNRGRLIAACFLAKDILIDWRYGEQYFMSKLIDGDFASNNGGWGFAASTGVDPQPYFRIFNPFTQSEKFDPKGDFIRKWVPELKEIEGKAVHNPYSTSAEAAEEAGYPRPIVDHKQCRERALERYKTAMQEGKRLLGKGGE